MGLISYAQNLEDIVLWRALRDVSSGYYVDIGAYDPAEDSVTKLFYDLGWRGINVEPVRACYEKFCAERPRDINLNIAVAERPCILTLHKIDNAGISTAVADIAARHAQSGWLSEPIEVPALSLRELMLDVKWEETHFLKIDVEGAEEAVLKGADFSKHRPWIVVVEAMAPGTQTQTHQAWSGLLERAGYTFVYFDGLNRFYLAKERSELQARFDAPPNIFDDYTTMREIRVHTKLAQAQTQLDQSSAEASGIARARQEDLRVREEIWAGERSENLRLNRELNTALSAISALEERLSSLDAERAENRRLVLKLHYTGRHMATLESRLAFAEATCEDLRRRIVNLRAEIAHPESAVAQARKVAKTQIDELTSKLSAQIELTLSLSAQIKKAAAQIEALTLSRSALLSSTSWRITAPLRKIRTALRVLLLNPRLLFPLIARNLLSNRLANEQNDAAHYAAFSPTPPPLVGMPADNERMAEPAKNGLLDQRLTVIKSEQPEGSESPLRLRFNARYSQLIQDFMS